MLRKGQRLFNNIEAKYGGEGLREGRLHQILFFMDDATFDKLNKL